MSPNMDTSLPPPFYQVGEYRFQELCADLLSADPQYLNPVAYGRRGQGQRGIDIEAPLGDGSGLHVGQCKAWSKASAPEVHQATTDFLPHLQYWREKGVKKFILFIGCAADDAKSQDQLRTETARFRDLGIDYEWWDARILRRNLRPYAHIVRTYCRPTDYWEQVICEQPIQTLSADAQSGLNSILNRQGYYIAELSEARNRDLAEVASIWEEGQVDEALRKLTAIQNTLTWPDLPKQIRAKGLRMHAGLLLTTSDSASEPRRLLVEAKTLEQANFKSFEALVVRRERGVSAAVDFLRNPTSPDEWNVRFRLLLELGCPSQVLNEIAALPKDISERPQISWSHGISLLVLRKVEESLQVLSSALAKRPTSFELRKAAAQSRYCCGISTAFPSWAHLIWPVPPPWHFVKRDDRSREERAKAEKEFEGLASMASHNERPELRLWHLACLADEPDRQQEAEQLCQSMLREAPGCVPALVWSQERGFEVDRQPSIAALRERVDHHSANAEDIICLFALVANSEGVAVAERLLDDQRPLFDAEAKTYIWRAHKAQALVGRSQEDAALRLVEEESDPLRKRPVRQAVLEAVSRKTGKPAAQADDLEAEFRDTGDVNPLIMCCIARRKMGDWQFIADHADTIVNLVGTEGALRLSVEGAFFAGRDADVQRLLTQNVHLCPASALPVDLKRLLAESYRRHGLLGKAVASAAEVAQANPDFASLAHLFQLQRAKGDIHGSVTTAQAFLGNPDVPAQFLAHEVVPAIRRKAPELARELVLQARKKILPGSAGSVSLGMEASKLGLRKLTQEVFARLPALAEQGAGGLELVTSAQIPELIKSQAKSWEQAELAYRQGKIPVHALKLHFRVLFAQWFLDSPRANQAKGYPGLGLTLLTRHGALAGAASPELDNQQELFLDITSLLLLKSLGLLEAVEEEFEHIAISGQLTAWLSAEVDELQPNQPERCRAVEVAFRLAQSHRIQRWSATAGPSPIKDAWADMMGPDWCKRLAHVRQRNSVLVDFLPLRANRPSMEPVSLPDAEAQYVIGASDVVAALEAQSIISANTAAIAYETLGRPQGAATAREAALHESVRFSACPEIHLEPGISEELALAGVLEPLAGSARLFVVGKEIDRWDADCRREEENAELADELEELIAHISKQFDTEHYRAHYIPKPLPPEGDNRPPSLQQLYLQDAFDYAEHGIGTLCCDDRFMRGLMRESARPFVDIWDLLNHLRQAGKLAADRYWDALTNARAANLRYLPVTEEEILHHLRRAPVEGGAVRETPGLVTLRRSIAACLLDAEHLQCARETPDGRKLLLEVEIPVRLYITAGHAIISIWGDESIPIENRTAQANWIWNYLWGDMRILPQLFKAPTENLPPAEAVGHSLGHLFAQGITLSGGGPLTTRGLYFQWLFDHCVALYLINDPGILVAATVVVHHMLDTTSQEMAEAERTDGKKSLHYIGNQVLMATFISDLPPRLQDALKLKQETLERFGLSASPGPIDVLGVGMRPEEFWSAVTRALDKGYAAVLKKGTRLQLSRDDASGRIRAARKGAGVRGGGTLNMPCLGLLEKEQSKRLQSLHSIRSWFDLDEPERSRVFDGIAEANSPAERVRLMNASLEGSATWLYTNLAERVRGQHVTNQPIFISDLLPESFDALRRHIRTSPLSLGAEEPSWSSAVGRLLRSEGLEESVVRLSCLPARLPEAVLTQLSQLSSAEISPLLVKLDSRLLSPVQRLHRLYIDLRFGGGLAGNIERAKKEVSYLLSPEGGVASARALLALFRWCCIRLGWSEQVRAWQVGTRIRTAWVHAGQIHAAFLSGGAQSDHLRKWIESNSQEMSFDALSPTPAFVYDVASVSQLTAEGLLLTGLADLADQLPEEVVSSLELLEAMESLTKDLQAFAEAVMPLWGDMSLKTNATGSFLGSRAESGFIRLLGGERFQYLWRTSPSDGIRFAIDSLSKDPHLAGAWKVLLCATAGGSLPTELREPAGRVIRSVDFLGAMSKDRGEAEQMILASCQLSSQLHDEQIRTYLYERVCDVALKAAEESAQLGLRGLDDDSMRNFAEALLPAMWHCCVVEGNPHQTLKRFADRLPDVLARWPAMALLCHRQTTGVLARLPLDYQREFWRCALTSRAWC